MLTIAEIEAACDASRPLDFSRHEIEAPELSLRATFYPYGFPAEIRTNSCEVLGQFEALWGNFRKQHDTEPLCADVQLVESDSTECPPAPTYRIMLPLLICVADVDNYSIVDLTKCYTKITVSRAALRYPLYAQYFLLGMAAACVATQHATPIHAACVELNGRGVLLCGDSGGGKSTLSYACARAGWTYLSDDASFLLNGGGERIVSGNSHQVRFRPSAAELFPELTGLQITPRAAGKPSIELPTAAMKQIKCADTARVDFVVFLKRNADSITRLLPYRKDVARYFMQQALYGLPESLAVQYAAIERLLAAGVFELRYNRLDDAINLLRALVSGGK
ncbi:MAG TPA: aldolase [Pseudacidobacterium sp.]|jgi:hypothetical protein|nr:aldolase [Pseudacidobacterium sp.]